MPSYPWLATAQVNGQDLPKHLAAMKTLGVPYTDEEVKGATEAVRGKTELDAVIAYLQVLGTAGPK
jgi:cytochrome c oxidase cbb3-type subunit 2